MPKRIKGEKVARKTPKQAGEETRGGDLSLPETVEMKVTVGEGIRRLPVYLLLDTSGSMAGAPIEAVRRGVEQFKREIEDDPFAKSTVRIGVITFGGEAEFITRGLVDIESFTPPPLSANGQTPLGQALWLLTESIDKDVKRAVRGGEKGDWKPLVYILTDGEPTDDWQKPVEEIRDRHQRRFVNIITVGCGPYLNQENLKNFFAGPTFNMGSDDDSFNKFFKWVTDSVIAAIKEVSKPGAGDKPATLPPPPDEIQYIP